jgi:negative regulator of sigma E activity
MNEPLRDPAPDPELRQALASLEPAPIDEVDWALLRGAIRDRAALPLAQRRRAQRTIPAWRRPLVPMAAAAGLALIVSTQLFRPATTGDVARADAQAGFRPVVEEVLGAQISETELDLLFGQVSADMLVVAAVDQP